MVKEQDDSLFVLPNIEQTYDVIFWMYHIESLYVRVKETVKINNLKVLSECQNLPFQEKDHFDKWVFSQARTLSSRIS